ncbi:MAG TPA: hypothetical protein O0X14_00275, partial [Methanocorpusculum sp.]|nr:hypothetical protein [Methanocorpusculum sp.]
SNTYIPTGIIAYRFIIAHVSIMKKVCAVIGTGVIGIGIWICPDNVINAINIDDCAKMSALLLLPYIIID